MGLTKKDISGLIDTDFPEFPKITEETKRVARAYGYGGVREAYREAHRVSREGVIKEAPSLFKRVYKYLNNQIQKVKEEYNKMMKFRKGF